MTTQAKELLAAAAIGEAPVRATIVAPSAAWDPFSLMDRLDADALVKEMQGVASDVLVYRIKESGKKEDTVGLSKQGVDECCTMLVQQGMCIREESIEHEFIGGDGDDREAIFKCVAARFAIDPATGREIRLDQVIGVKREPLYEERAPLTLDSRVPGKRWRDKGADGKHLTYREALDESHPANENRGEAISYLHWIVDESQFDQPTKQFIAAALAGVDVQEWAAGKRFNPFWYEHGAMKAARNARFRLVPAELKAKVVALAKQTGREMEAEVETTAANTQRSERRPAQATAKVAEKPRVLRRDPKRLPIYGWLFSPHIGVPIDAMTKPGEYVISDDELNKAMRFAERGLSGAEVRKGDGTRGVLDEDERKTVEKLKLEIEAELFARLEYQATLADERAEQRERSESVELGDAERAARTTE